MPDPRSRHPDQWQRVVDRANAEGRDPYEAGATRMGHRIVRVFVLTATALHWYYLGFKGVFTFQAAAFVVIGMMCTMLVLGPVAYGVFRTSIAVAKNSRLSFMVGFSGAWLVTVAGTMAVCWTAFRWLYAL